MSLLPAPFLFRFTLPAKRIDALPRNRSPLLKFPESARVPFPSAMEAEPQFAQLALAWNTQGLALEVSVKGKKKKPFCNPDAIATSDAVRIWIDTRDTQTQHRGSRYCLHFVSMPYGAGEKGTDPVIRQLPVPRAREDAPDADPELFLAESDISQASYRLALWFPKESLHGFDPGPGTRLGFYLAVQDTELGRQTLTIAEEFPFDVDPSLWVSVELV